MRDSKDRVAATFAHGHVIDGDSRRGVVIRDRAGAIEGGGVRVEAVGAAGVVDQDADREREAEQAVLLDQLTDFDWVESQEGVDWKLAGKRLARLDTVDKTTGAQVYGMDLKMPGMLNAAIRQCPVLGGKLAGFDNRLKREEAEQLHREALAMRRRPSP